jgi:hypothetical protein
MHNGPAPQGLSLAPTLNQAPALTQAPTGPPRRGRTRVTSADVGSVATLPGVVAPPILNRGFQKPVPQVLGLAPTQTQAPTLTKAQRARASVSSLAPALAQASPTTQAPTGPPRRRRIRAW